MNRFKDITLPNSIDDLYVINLHQEDYAFILHILPVYFDYVGLYKKDSTHYLRRRKTDYTVTYVKLKNNLKDEYKQLCEYMLTTYEGYFLDYYIRPNHIYYDREKSRERFYIKRNSDQIEKYKQGISKDIKPTFERYNTLYRKDFDYTSADSLRDINRATPWSYGDEHIIIDILRKSVYYEKRTNKYCLHKGKKQPAVLKQHFKKYGFKMMNEKGEILLISLDKFLNFKIADNKVRDYLLLDKYHYLYDQIDRDGSSDDEPQIYQDTSPNRF